MRGRVRPFITCEKPSRVLGTRTTLRPGINAWRCVCARTLRDMSTWDEAKGQVTQAFDEWRLYDMDLRSFLRVSLLVAEESFDRWWHEILSQPGDPDVDAIDLWEKRTQGIHMHDYSWMLLSGGLVNAVTAFEVYLEKVREEVLRHRGYSHRERTDRRALTWWESTEFVAEALDVGLRVTEEHPKPQDLNDVRDLRHIIVHKRGELRTEDDRERFDPDRERWLREAVQLDLAQTLERMDVLAKYARVVDAAAYGATWGDDATDALQAYISKKAT